VAEKPNKNAPLIDVPTSRVRLGVNVDHVATLREARGCSYPDPVQFAAVAELAGADQITVHLREDRRHIQDRDLRLMRESIQTRLNLEMAATREMLSIALEAGPDEVTLVPERREELTTEGGLKVAGASPLLAAVVKALQQAGIMVSLFIDPATQELEAAAKLGVEAVELHTGAYCDAKQGSALRREELNRLEQAASRASSLELMVAAGHGLNYQNLEPVVAIDEIVELNIGHAIVARALSVGFHEAVNQMRALLFR